MKNNYTTPILFIVFNRIDTVKIVFESIKSIKPEFLFVAADGYRNHVDGEFEKCNEVRDYIVKNVDWKCDLKLLFQEKNLGCGLGPSTAISWFFDQVESGIILEDDCLPHPDFFVYCEALLNKYRYNEKVSMISGDNFQNGNYRGSASYYVSAITYNWGWATWKRVWNNYQYDVNKLDKRKLFNQICKFFSTKREQDYWKFIFNSLTRGTTDVWDYQFTLSSIYNNQVAILPNVNLVSNIGFGVDATHTNQKDKRLCLETKKILPITHLKTLKRNRKAELYSFDKYENSNLKYSFKERFFSWLLYIKANVIP